MYDTKVNLTADGWALYTCSRKCGGAARRMNAAATRTLTALAKRVKKVDPDDVEELERAIMAEVETHFYPTARALSTYGANDTEPCCVMQALIMDRIIDKHTPPSVPLNIWI